MKPENAIEVRDVQKHFKVYKDKGHMLRERLIHISRNKYEMREVLRGISFDVKKGESVGLIGKNGCGKSTTLKLLTKILRPNGGTIDIQGRVCSLIELGAGFHPDMSGRENIYINASIFGIKAKEVDQRLNDIIRFSELEEFIDNPVRTYSSGMYMRLAFSVAINVDADILLIDEILAVGDNAFQTKCFNKLKSLKDQGTTIVIVSHALGQVERLCDRAIWIDEGLIRDDGPARKVCKEYLEKMEESRLERAELEYRMELEEQKRRAAEEERRKKEAEQQQKEAERQKKEQKLLQDRKLKEEEKQRRENERKRREQEKIEERNRKIAEEKREAEKRRNASCREVATQCSPDARREGNGKVYFTEVKMLDRNEEESILFSSGDSVKIKMHYKSLIPGTAVNIVIGISRSDWIYCYGASLQHEDGNFVVTKEEGYITLEIEKINLLDGKYTLEVRIQDEEKVPYDYLSSLINFTIKSEQKKAVGIVAMPYNWKTSEPQIKVGKII